MGALVYDTSGNQVGVITAGTDPKAVYASIKADTYPEPMTGKVIVASDVNGTWITLEITSVGPPAGGKVPVVAKLLGAIPTGYFKPHAGDVVKQVTDAVTNAIPALAGDFKLGTGDLAPKIPLVWIAAGGGALVLLLLLRRGGGRYA